MINSAGTGAAFNSDQGKAVLQALHQMRFVDHSMSPTQQLAWGTLQKQMAANKLGMYIAAPDDIYNVIVPQDGGNINDYGMGPLPSTSGTPAGSLSGGNDYMFAKRDTPAQIEAGIKWLVFENLTPGVGFYNYARQKADGFPVGFPEPQMFTGATEAKQQQLMTKSATVNPAYFSTFASAHELAMGEPADAQAVYKTLDPVMLEVLTNPNANISQLLSTATSQVNQILATAKGAQPNTALSDAKISMAGYTVGLKDTRDYYNHDIRFIIATTLLVVLLTLMVLLRALIAPLYLVASVVVSYLSAVGIGASSPYSAPPVEVKTTGVPRRPAHSSTLSVPRTLTSQSRPGFSTETTTLDCAARWKTFSGLTSSNNVLSRSSSTMSSSCSSASGATRAASPEERSSTTVTA